MCAALLVWLALPTIWKSPPIFSGANGQLIDHYKPEDTNMKITYTITMASALLLAAGCAHEQRTAGTDETGYSSGRMSEYNNQNNYSTTPAVGGSYSTDGSPSYSGSVGADGMYTPNAGSDSSVTAAGGYVGSAGRQSDDTVVAQVRESLRQDPEIALIVPNIQISAHNGAIILSGSVQSEEQKRQIFSRVQNITGVVAVNNQLNVMAGANGRNPNNSQLNPTGSGGDSQRLYKDAEGQDSSTNNALNSTSRQNGQPQLYQQSNEGNGELNPTSRPNEQSQVLQDGQMQNGQQPNSQQQNTSTQSDANANKPLDPTSRTNSSNQIYHENNENQTGQPQNMNQSSNSVNDSSNSLNPTSRQNGSSQIYQNNPGENAPNANSQNQNTNNVQGTTQNQ
jgi:osmotically-inducible protein OsmY